MINEGFEPVMNPEVLAGKKAGNPPRAGGMIEDANVLVTHAALEVCGIGAAAARNVFIQVEGISSIEAFGALSCNSDVMEMAKRMASRNPGPY